MFLCTCILQLWPPCRKFLVKTLKKFCWISGNEEKLISLPKNWFVKIFVWTCTTNFWQACRNRACKSTKGLFGSKFENNSNAKFSKKKNFPPFSPLRIKKNFIWARRMQLWPHCLKFLVKILRNFCWNSWNYENLMSFRKNLFVKMFVWKCITKFWQDCRNFVAKNTKKFPIIQTIRSYNLFIRICFHQKWFFPSNGECNFDKPTKIFSPKNHRFVTQITKRNRENMNFLEGNLFFLNLCFGTCRM